MIGYRPIARTVADAVYVLDVIAGFDENDEGTIEASKYIPLGGYKQFLKPEGLKGKRLGIVRHPFVEKESDVSQAFELHVQTLRYAMQCISNFCLSWRNDNDQMTLFIYFDELL